ncbi:hypothetical protein [Brevundimonas aurantiaca]|uniref:hypothetical protein n=1 Tax=Brevundimonas aurantiaca TaxID=74316 RepID=UPI001918242C|nr:hypothetical protein [Brevundimonas aurantiaca]
MSVSAQPRPPFQRPDWRKAGLAALAAAINIALIAALSVTALGIDGEDFAAEPPPIYLDIEPRPLLPDERPRIPSMATPDVAPAAAPTASSSPSVRPPAAEAQAVPRPAPCVPASPPRRRRARRRRPTSGGSILQTAAGPWPAPCARACPAAPRPIC